MKRAIITGITGQAVRDLGWATEITAHEMCIEMVNSDYLLAKKETLLNNHPNF